MSESIKKKQLLIKTEITKLVDKYSQLTTEKANVEGASVAYVTFRSMEGAARCLKAHEREKKQRNWLGKTESTKDFAHL